MSKKETNYPEEKQELIKTYTNDRILMLLNDVKGDARTLLNNKVLNGFVVDKFKQIKDNAKKYGEETKENFCKALRGELNTKGYFSDSQNKNKITPQEKAFIALIMGFNIWCIANDEIDTEIIPKGEAKNEEWIKLIKNLLENSKKDAISKETLKILYDFSPILPDTNLEIKINQCKSKYDVISKMQAAKCKTLQDEVADLQTKNKKHISKIENMTQRLNEQKNTIETLEAEISQTNNLKEDYKELDLKYKEEINNNKTLEQKIKQLKSTDMEKLKENLKQQLYDKDAKIQELNEQLIDYEELKQKNDELSLKNDSLQKFKAMNLKQIYADIENNKEYQRKLKQLILSDKKTCDLIIKKLNLKEVIVQEISARKEQILLESSDELKILQNKKESLSKEINASIEILDEIKEEHSNVSNKIITNENVLELSETLFELPLKEPAMFDYINFQVDFLARNDKNEEIYNKKLCQKLCNEQIIIINEFDEFKTWYRCQNYDFDPLIVIPEFDWTSYKDWFGYFDNNKFIPANTLISDYYKILKENPDIPLGVIVIKDFNKILPDIYLEYFIEKITEKITPGVYLAHPTQSIPQNDEIFRHITLPKNLKLILVKSDSPKAFEIPLSMKKFEVDDSE